MESIHAFQTAVALRSKHGPRQLLSSSAKPRGWHRAKRWEFNSHAINKKGPGMTGGRFFVWFHAKQEKWMCWWVFKPWYNCFFFPPRNDLVVPVICFAQWSENKPKNQVRWMKLPKFRLNQIHLNRFSCFSRSSGHAQDFRNGRNSNMTI